MRESSEINQRTFNENDVIGNFPRDRNGRIKMMTKIKGEKDRIWNRKEIIYSRNFRDFDGQMVNERGYLINEVSGAIRSKYTYEDIMIGEYSNMGDLGELPMPYRLERYNFNPHQILGSFKYEEKKNGKPILLQNKFGQYTDTLFRPVNIQGFLVNENMDVVDDEGRVRFTVNQLELRANLPMFTYKGESFEAKDIIGQFEKDPDSKKIMPIISQGEDGKGPGRATDMKGHLVNAAGYLIDEQGNIVSKGNKALKTKAGKVMFNFWEIMYNEPPKIFEFTEFDLKWIKGRLDRDVTKNPRHDDEYDLDGRMINSLGYLIDLSGNILDQNGKMVFRKEILKQAYGQDARIPPIFTMNKLIKPESDEPVVETPDNTNRILDGQLHNQTAVSGITGGANYETDAISNAPGKNINQSAVFSDVLSKKKDD